MSSTQIPPATPDPDTLYAAVDGRMASLGTDEAVFFAKATGRSQVMTRDVAHAFSLCRAFLPLDTHIERIIQALPALKGQDAAVRKVLEMLSADGMMQTDAQFIAGFLAETVTPQAPVSGLFLCASEKPGLLASALDAVAGHARRFGLEFPVHVLDLSRDAAVAQAHTDVIAGFVRDTGVQVRHIDAIAAEKITAQLETALPEHAASLRWLLTPAAGSTGAARNLAALLGAGTRYLVLDVATTLPLLRHPEYVPGLYPDSRAFALRSFASVPAAQSAGNMYDEDPLALHLSVCGLSLAEAMACVPDAILQRDSIDGVIAARAPWLRPGHRVAFTGVGRVGRFALADPTLIFKLGEVERAGLVATREDYLATSDAPILWSGTRHFAAGLAEYLSPLAFDASRLVACTLPDAPRAVELQVELQRLADADSVDFDFPQALLQGDPGQGADDALGRPDTAQCLSGLVRVVAQDLYADAPAPRLGVLAAKLEDLAGGGNLRVHNYLVEYLAWYRSSAIEQMQNALAATASPPIYWAADLRTAVEAQGKALIGGETPRLADWPVQLDEAGCVSHFKSRSRALAAGLRAWPVAFELAVAHSAGWRAGGA